MFCQIGYYILHVSAGNDTDSVMAVIVERSDFLADAVTIDVDHHGRVTQMGD